MRHLRNMKQLTIKIAWETNDPGFRTEWVPALLFRHFALLGWLEAQTFWKAWPKWEGRLSLTFSKDGFSQKFPSIEPSSSLDPISDAVPGPLTSALYPVSAIMAPDSPRTLSLPCEILELDPAREATSVDGLGPRMTGSPGLTTASTGSRSTVDGVIAQSASAQCFANSVKTQKSQEGFSTSFDFDKEVVHWNAIAKRMGWPTVRTKTKIRELHLRKRLEERPTLWNDILNGALKVSFSTLRLGFFTFDWFVKSPNNLAKFMDGNYEERRSTGSMGTPGKYRDPRWHDSKFKALSQDGKQSPTEPF